MTDAPYIKKLAHNGGLPTGNYPEADKLAYASPVAQIDLVRAGYLAGLEAAAKYHDEIYEHDASGIEYSSMVGIPISNKADLEQSCRRAEMDACAIRAISLDQETTIAIVARVTEGK